MPLKLILIRHAKSDWGDPLLRDHDRRLNDRGRRDAPRIGAWLTAQGHVPDTVRLSTAARVQETWAGVSSAFMNSVEASHHPDLYHAEPERILAHARAGNGQCLAIVAHNPGIGEAAALLAETAPDHPRFGQYPTAATTVLAFDGDDWSTIGLHAGRVLDFVTPHDLP